MTCSYLLGGGAEWVEKSLLLAAIGESRDRGAVAMEAFAYSYPEGESVEERFLVHRTVFPRDFLEEFGFRAVRAQGRVELCRLELGGLKPVAEGKRARVLRVVQDAFVPQPGAGPGPLTATAERWEPTRAPAHSVCVLTNRESYERSADTDA